MAPDLGLEEEVVVQQAEVGKEEHKWKIHLGNSKQFTMTTMVPKGGNRESCCSFKQGQGKSEL
jgi:hypothetical protein